MSQAITERDKEQDKITDRRSQISEKREKEKRVRTGKRERRERLFLVFSAQESFKRKKVERERER